MLQTERKLSVRRVIHASTSSVPFHLQECFRYLGHNAGDFSESERAADETIAVPIYPELTMAQQTEVVEAIASWY